MHKGEFLKLFRFTFEKQVSEVQKRKKLAIEISFRVKNGKLIFFLKCVLALQEVTFFLDTSKKMRKGKFFLVD